MSSAPIPADEVFAAEVRVEVIVVIIFLPGQTQVAVYDGQELHGHGHLDFVQNQPEDACAFRMN